jgi:dTDP-4-dehydrorhamnose 3,5-epimerase
MEIRQLRLGGTYEIQLDPRHDERGHFMRCYDEAIFREYGLATEWKQDNQSLSRRKGVIRGLHFQLPPHAETKLVRVVTGEILDVFVDLRKGSCTYGQWDARTLSEANSRMVYVPKGFAHGFCTLTDIAIVQYKVDEYYVPQAEGGIRWDDKTLDIEWPAGEHILSERDRSLPLMADLASPF